MQEKLSTPISSISSVQISGKPQTPFTKIYGRMVDLIPTLMFPAGFDSLEIDGVGFDGVVGSSSSCEGTS